MSDLSKILAENNTEMMRLIAPAIKKKKVMPMSVDSDSEDGNVPLTISSSAPICVAKTETRNDTMRSRNKGCCNYICCWVIK